MHLSKWLLPWKIVILFMVYFLHVESHHDMLHYFKLKKFLTAVAFARALGKRPTVLPVPIPIPIPIAQNEIIKLPLPSGGKTTVIGSDTKQVSGISQLLGGSSTYGYAQPSTNTGNINLQSLSGNSDSNVVSLASLLGNNGNSGSPKIIVVGGQNSGNGFGGSMNPGPSVIHLNGLGNNNYPFPSNANNYGNGYNDLDSAFSYGSPKVFQFPNNVYSDRPFRRVPFKFSGRSWKNPVDMNYMPTPRFNFYPTRKENFDSSNLENHDYHQDSGNNQMETDSNSQGNADLKKGNHKKPIPVGEKFDRRP